MRNIGIDRLIGITDRRPDHPAIGVDLILNEGGFVVGLGQEPTEFFLRIINHDRHQNLTLVGGEDGFVIGDEFRDQAQEKQDQEQPEGPVTAPVCLEILPTALGGWRKPRALRFHQRFRFCGMGKCHHTSLRSKSIRGSIHV